MFSYDGPFHTVMDIWGEVGGGDKDISIDKLTHY